MLDVSGFCVCVGGGGGVINNLLNLSHGEDANEGSWER